MTSLRIDHDAIRELGLREVVDRLGLLEQDPKRGDRYRFRGYDGSYWISLDFDQNVWHGFKYGTGGSPRDLVMSSIAGPPDYDYKRDETELYKEAAKMMAEAFGLWETNHRERGQKLAKQLSKKGKQTPKQWMAELVERIEQGGGGFEEAWAETDRLLDALGIAKDRVTLCPSEQSGLCWQPGVPWQGQDISRNLEKGYFGGWTKARAIEHSGNAESLRVLMYDFDGDTSTGKAPLESLIRRLATTLKHEGLPVSALVWSSAKEEGREEGRSKAHLYFCTKHPAPNHEVWLEWWKALAEILWETTDWSDIHPDERELLRHDDCTGQLQRLVRLPGFAKPGAESAAVVEFSRAGRSVDVATWLETRDQDIIIGPTHSQHWGSTLCFESKGVEGERKKVPLARAVFPVAPYSMVDDDEHGVLYRFHTQSGRVQYLKMKASAFGDTSAAKRAAADAAGNGVRIATGQGAAFGLGLGHWREHTTRPVVQLVTDPGWHVDGDGKAVYANGAEVHGSATWRADPSTESHGIRGKRRGDLGRWLELASLLDTPGLLVALATGLAGAMLEPVRRDSFIVNLHGSSTAGKTTALRVASCLWGRTSDVLKTWDTSAAALDGIASMYDDACLPLDELHLFVREKQEADVSRAIHTLAGVSGRTRMTREAQIRETRTWRITVLSSSEVAIRDLVGSAWRGGDGVRALDIAVDHGELTHSSEHAEKIRELTDELAGVVSDAWVQYLLGRPDGELRETWRRWSRELRAKHEEVGAEGGRVLDHMAVLGSTLEHAAAAGLLPSNLPWEQVIKAWAVSRALGGAGRQMTPQERMLSLLVQDIETRPGRYPRHTDDRQARERHGILVEDSIPSAGKTHLWTTEVMLKTGPLTGHPVRPWLKWAREEGLARYERGSRLMGIQASWHVFDLAELDRRATDTSIETTSATRGGADAART